MFLSSAIINLLVLFPAFAVDNKSGKFIFKNIVLCSTYDDINLDKMREFFNKHIPDNTIKFYDEYNARIHSPVLVIVASGKILDNEFVSCLKSLEGISKEIEKDRVDNLAQIGRKSIFLPEEIDGYKIQPTYMKQSSKQYGENRVHYFSYSSDLDKWRKIELSFSLLEAMYGLPHGYCGNTGNC